MILKFIPRSKSLWAMMMALLVSMASVAQDTPEKPEAPKGTLIDKIIAKVDNQILLKSDLEMAYLNYISGGQQAFPDTKCRILAQLITSKLMVAKAEIDSVMVSDLEVENNVERRMQMIVSQSGGSREKLEAFYGKSLDQIKDELRDQVKEQLVVNKMQKTLTDDIKVTPSEVRKFFNKIPKDSLPYLSKEVELAQIVKIPEVSKAQKEIARNKINEVRSLILNGQATFEEMAQKHSADGSARDGGNLGWASRGMMVPEFEAAALRLRPDEISGPVESQFGFHLIQLIERRGNEYNSRHILIIPESSPEDVRQAERYLDSLRTRILSDTITFEKAAKEYSDDKMSATAGGFFMDESGSTRVSVEDLDPVVYFTIDTLKVGTITRPMTFRLDDGKEAVRILYYKSSIPPHQANLKDDWTKIHAAAVNEKKARILDKWFDKVREDVFISIDKDYDHCGLLD
jgi:peptidyl-prolyl cis-trans isomerase SurA